MVPEHDLFANFERMRREIDELFGDVFGRGSLTPRRRVGFTPLVDVSYADGPPRVIVTAALPGVHLDELELEIHQRQLHLAGYRRPVESETRVYQQIEIEHGPFHRVIELDADVVAERTQASFQDGMLHIELPLALPERARHAITIEVSREPAAVNPARSGQTPQPREPGKRYQPDQPHEPHRPDEPDEPDRPDPTRAGERP